MRRKQAVYHRQFFALLAILSFTFTQVLPAWALRADDRATLRPSIEGKSQSGLEEILAGAGVLDPSAYGVLRDAQGRLAEGQRNVRAVTPEETRMLGDVYRFLHGLEPELQNVPELVIRGARKLRLQSPGLARWLPSEQELREQMKALWSAAPGEACAGCGAMATLAVANPAAHPHSHLQESEQGEAFNNWERRTAALILARLIRTQGGIAFLQSPDGHRMPADSLADLLQFLNAIQGSTPREQWMGGRATMDELAGLVRRGRPVMVSLDGVHHVTVYDVRDRQVVVSQPVLSPDGSPANKPVAMPVGEFARQWTGGGPEGLLLTAFPIGEKLPPEIAPVGTAELAAVHGCCGVVNVPRPYTGAESLYMGMPIQPDVNMYRRASEAIQILESRGFDNSSLLLKLDIPLAQLRRDRKYRATPELRAWADENQVHLSVDKQGNLVGVRLFAEARVAGAFTANEEAMKKAITENIRLRVAQLLEHLGERGAVVLPEPESPDWVVLVPEQGGVLRRWGALVTRGLFVHTRFATKGGYQASNAHLWVIEYEGGVWTLSHNGDWESYDWARDYFESELFPQENENLPPQRAHKFEGTTDSETMLNLVARLGVTRDGPGGRVIQLESEATALRRAFRALDVLEALRAAAKQLAAAEETILKLREKLAATQDAKKKSQIQADIQHKQQAGQRVLALLGNLGFEPKDLTPIKQKDQTVKPNRAAYLKFLRDILEDPAILDHEATAENGYKGCFIFTEHQGRPIEQDAKGQAVPVGLGAYLKAVAPDPYGGENGVFGKGLIITIQVSALHSDSGGVTAKTYSESTDAYFLIRRSEAGDVQEILTASEVRGFSPQVGISEDEFELRPGLFVVYGKADVFVSRNWAIYTTDGTRLTETPVFTHDSQEVNLSQEAKSTPSSWVEARTEEARELRRTISPFELEAMVQSITLAKTLDRRTRMVSGLWQTSFDQVEDGSGVSNEVVQDWVDAENRYERYKSGSGSSTFTMMIGEHRAPTDAVVDNSDAIRLEPTPRTFTGDTRMLIATQSGTTGAAKNLWDKVHRAKGVLVAMTNTPGSPIFLRGVDSGGVLLTYSTPETAVAATGTTVHQLVLDILWGLHLLWKRGEISAQELDREIKLLRGLVSRVGADETLQPGTLQKVLDSFFSPKAQGEEGKHNGKSFYWRGMDLVAYKRAVSERGQTDSRKHHYRDDARLSNVTIIGVCDPATPNEVGLKIVEQTGQPALVIPSSSTALEMGISSGDGRIVGGRAVEAEWNPSRVADTVRANRAAFEGTGGLLLPEGQKIRRVLIVGNGEDQQIMNLIRATYRTAMPLSVEAVTYEQAYTRGRGGWKPRPGTAVIFVRPGEAAIPGSHQPESDAGQLNNMADQLMSRWGIERGSYPSVFLCSAARTASSQDMERRHRWAEGRALLMEGAPEDREFSLFGALDRFFSEAVVLALDRSDLPETVKEEKRQFVADQQASRDETVASGIGKTISNTVDVGGYNREGMDRIAAFANARGEHRGWRGFNIWPAGYGPREFLARDMALQVRRRLQFSNYAEQPSNGSHGYMGGMHPGGELLLWYPPIGEHESAAFAEDYDKKVKEAIPRAVNPPFPTDAEPGMFVEIGTESQLLSKSLAEDSAFVELRRLRHNAQEKSPDGKVNWTMPDAFLATPTGDPLEVLVLNRLVSQELQAARAKAVSGKGPRWFGSWEHTESAAGWERRGEVVIVVDTGEPLPYREVFYRNLRQRFPKWECVIVVMAPQNSDPSVFQNADVVFDLPTGHPAEILAATHGLSTILARSRYEGISKRTEQVFRLIQEELKKQKPSRGVFGKHDFPDRPLFRGVAEIVRLYAQYADLDPRYFDPKKQAPSDHDLKERVLAAVRDFEATHQEQLFETPKDEYGKAVGLPVLDKRGLKGLLEDALEIYRIQLPLVAGHALNAEQLTRYLIFQIQGLAKVVTNLSPFQLAEGFRRAQPELTSATVGALARDETAWRGDLEGALREAAQDPAGARLLNAVLEADGEPQVKGEPERLALEAANLLAPRIQQLARDFVAADPGAALQPIVLTLGAPTLAGTTEEGGVTLDLGVFLADGLGAMALGDEMSHREMETAVSSLRTLGVQVEGANGEDGTLVQQALAEASFVLGEVQRFQALPETSRAQLLSTLENGRSLAVAPEFRGLLEAAHQGEEVFTLDGFVSALQVVAATKPYGPVAVAAESILGQDPTGAWAAAEPLLAGVSPAPLPSSAGLEEVSEADIRAIHRLSVDLVQRLMDDVAAGRVRKSGIRFQGPMNLSISDLSGAQSFVRAHPDHYASYLPADPAVGQPDRLFLGAFEQDRSRISPLAVSGQLQRLQRQVVGTVAPPATVVQTTGLEEMAESPLDLPLPDRWPSYEQAIERLRQARESSGFLRVVRDRLREGEGVPSGYRALEALEIRALEANRVRAVDGWQRIYVPTGFGMQDIDRIFNVRLYGTVVLGRLRGTAAFDPSGIFLQSRVENTDLRDMVLGNDVLIQFNTLLERYVVGDRAVITHNRSVIADKGTTFGIGVSIPVGPETGGRAFKAYPEMLFEDVMRLVISPRDAQRAEYEAEHAKYMEAAKGDYGYIGAGAIVSGNGIARNLFVADGGVVVETSRVENLILLGEGTGSEQSRVEGAGEVLNVMAQQGVEIGPQAVVIATDAKSSGVLMLEHSHADGALIQDSVIAPNSGAGRGSGEVTSAVMGPFTGMHHSSLLIAAVLPGMGNLGAEVAVHSNHTSRQPSEEFWGGEGDFYGLNTSYSGTTNLQDAPYSIWAKVNALAQVMRMPFSLVQEPTITIPGSSPGFMQITPGWVWSDNAYAIMRNEGKYAKRDKAKKHKLGLGDLQRRPYEVLRPSIVNKMIRARDAVRSVDVSKARRGVIATEDPNKPRIVEYYTEKEIPGLGKNFMVERSRAKAEETYNFMIRYYALRGLYEEVKKLEATGRLDQVAALVSTPSQDPRWEHERRTLLTELPGVSVADGLRQFAEMQATLQSRVRFSRNKDNERGEEYLPGYNEAHDPADDDSFVKQITAETETVRNDVDRIAAALPQAGLEEGAVGQAMDPAELARSLQVDFGALRMAVASAATVGMVVDLTVDETGRPNLAGALLAPYLPAGTVAIVRSLDDLLTAEQIIGRTTQAQVVTLDAYKGSFSGAALDAVSWVSARVESVRFMSGRSENDIRAALGGLAASVNVIAPSPLASILEALGVDEGTRIAFMALFQRARDNWDGLVKYL